MQAIAVRPPSGWSFDVCDSFVRLKNDKESCTLEADILEGVKDIQPLLYSLANHAKQLNARWAKDSMANQCHAKQPPVDVLYQIDRRE